VPSATFLTSIFTVSAFTPNIPIAFVTPAGTATVSVTAAIVGVPVGDLYFLPTFPSNKLDAGYKAFSLDAVTDVATFVTALDFE
jgi:hypothetical protein